MAYACKDDIDRYKKASKKLHALSRKWSPGGVLRMLVDPSGICYLITPYLDFYEREALLALCKVDYCYPVNHPVLPPRGAYYTCNRWREKYGDDKRKLAKQMADKLDEVIRANMSLRKAILKAT